MYLLRYCIYNIRLGRNIKCTCDDCCGLGNLAKRFEEEGKPEEAAMATKALLHHKKRAEFKQSRYRIARANAAASCVYQRPFMDPKPSLTTPTSPTSEPTDDCKIESEHSSNKAGSCKVHPGMTLMQLHSASHTDLVNEIKAHDLKCRRDKESMKQKLEKHFLEVHDVRPIRCIKRKSDDANLEGSCKAEPGLTLIHLHCASHTELVSEIKSHGLKSRKDKESMKQKLEKHYLEVHNVQPIRGIKQKF